MYDLRSEHAGSSGLFSLLNVGLPHSASNGADLVQILVVVWMSERFRERLKFSAWSNVWTLPPLIGLCIPPVRLSSMASKSHRVQKK